MTRGKITTTILETVSQERDGFEKTITPHVYCLIDMTLVNEYMQKWGQSY